MGKFPGFTRWVTAVALAVTSMFCVVGVALADLSQFGPSSGTVQPGGTTSTDFTLTPPMLPLGLPGTSCLTATVSPNPLHFTITLDGLGLNLLPANCGLGSTPVEMRVRANSSAASGNYLVTVTEVELLQLGGDLIDTHTWPFTVSRPPSTTSSTTSSTTITTTTSPGPTTSTPSTSPTSNPTTTSASPSPTTSTPPSPSTSTPVPSDPTDTIPRPGSPSSATTGADTTSTSRPQDEADAEEDDEQPTTSSPESPVAGPPGGSDGGDQDGLAAISTSEGLRQTLGAEGPNALADAIFSPLMIAEILLRSLAEGATAFLLPLLLILLFGAWLVWKMRKERDNEADSDPSLGGPS